ncbi:MAG: Quinone oxidoreductase 1 [Alphaproteobacteria bacterium MarineAlpha9_Bin4]|nr:quinone oxidoreductase [Pelagibacterales bacterium]PPR27280.1 MAG: Quinone oxidoreductase 1 [Alphaproteobacteria bacterium MarineAlpha9_Bin4]|tara:strand:+ start:3054 stop:4037 length:984 start_codon:yes stop_codon:yes gene_type:complete
MKSKTIIIRNPGPAENMKWENLNIDSPSQGFVTVKHSYVGLNYIDTYHRSGLYPLPLPATIGMEGAGEVIDTGEETKLLKKGDKVVYALGPPGSYSDIRNIPESKCIKLPDYVDDKTAAALMLKGMTVEYLAERTFPLNNKHTVLFHAIAGGVGQIATQWIKNKGAKIIGTAGNREKAEIAKNNGCDEVILYNDTNFVDAVMDITNGEGVNVVYDGVGKATALKSLDCLAPLGMLVIFGNSSGNAPPIDPSLLASKGSLFLTRPTLMTYNSKASDMHKSAKRVFEMLKSNSISANIGNEYLLSDIVNVHKALENRETKGSIVLKNDH